MNQMNNICCSSVLNKVESSPEKTITISVVVSLCIAFVILCLTSLDLGDSDLWFHLNQGREFFATGKIPTTSFFSYIEPTRHWVNYAWFFQIVTYQIFIHTGYVGLIVFRSLAYVSIGVLLYLIVLKNRPYSILAALLTILCFIGVMTRSVVVRPHIFTFINILILLFIFEKRKFFWLLPIVFVIEANFHGIAYPLLLLVLCGYILDYYLCYKNTNSIPISKKKLFLVLVSPLFLLLSPYWYHLISLPFENAASFVSYYIIEMRPTPFWRFFSFSFWPMPELLQAARSLLVLVAFSILIFSLYKKKITISCVVIFCGGIYLMTTSIRFQYECIFFTLPLFLVYLRNMDLVQNRKKLMVNMALVVFVPISVFSYFLYRSDHYPLSFLNVPQAGAKFIYELPKDQRVLMAPDKAGYFAWSLFPKHKIFMDLELALFNDVDAFEAMRVFRTPAVLEHHIEKYHPSVLHVPFETGISPEYTAVLKNFRPVFFDDFAFIYLRRDVPSAFPELSYLNTIAAQQVDEDAFTTSEEKSKLIKELKRVADFDASGFKVKVLLGNAYFAFQLPQPMLEMADKLIREFPDQAAGFILKAQALLMLKKQESVEYFKLAMSKRGDHDMQLLGKNYYVALASFKRFTEAYDVLQQAYNPFNFKTPPDILYEFAIGAVNAGKYDEAKQYIDIALLALPENDESRINELLRLKRELQIIYAEKDT